MCNRLAIVTAFVLCLGGTSTVNAQPTPGGSTEHGDAPSGTVGGAGTTGSGNPAPPGGAPGAGMGSGTSAGDARRSKDTVAGTTTTLPNPNARQGE